MSVPFSWEELKGSQSKAVVVVLYHLGQVLLLAYMLPPSPGWLLKFQALSLIPARKDDKKINSHLRVRHCLRIAFYTCTGVLLARA